MKDKSKQDKKKKSEKVLKELILLYRVYTM